MAGTPARSSRCESARHAVSLSLDGELSDFERVLLAAHVKRCSACRAFQAELVGLTASLRLASPEPLAHPITLPHRRRVVQRANALSAAAAAAVAVAAVGLGTVLTSSQPDRAGRRLQAPVVAVNQLQSDDVLVRAVQHSTPPPPQIGIGFEL